MTRRSSDTESLLHDVSRKNVLALDVGNTDTRFGVFSAGELAGTWTLTTPERMTTDEARMQVGQVLRLLGVDLPGGVILACVVPSLLDVWTRALAVSCAVRPLVVGPGLKTGIRMRYDDPAEVGADRIADIVAARTVYGAPVVAVDLGTSTNFEIVDSNGIFVGGIIAPGFALGAHALAKAAARLPEVELRAPKYVIGRNTRAAILSGVIFGEIARMDGLLDAIMNELETEAPIVLTGKDADVMGPLLGHQVSVDENLTMRGLYLLWCANQR